VALPADYDTDPGRFRLGSRIAGKCLTLGTESLHGHIAGVLARAGTRLVADVGCGEGALSAAVRPPWRPRIVGLDASPAMLAACPPPRPRARPACR
jgi:SAM-dependent methyltransferase